MTANPPTLRYIVGSTVVPGDRLGNIRQCAPGAGTYVKGGNIYASLVGTLALQEATATTEMDTTTDADTEAEESSSSSMPYTCVVEQTSAKQPASHQVLRVGQLVLGRIVRVTPQNVIVEICVAEHVGTLSSFPEGAIRLEDVRTLSATEAASFSLEQAFQPGDLVVSRVISIGDSRRYFMSTAETELGVVRAKSTSSGAVMIPVSWKEMECPETGAREPRKVAKPSKTTMPIE
jgi:exosome complex component CSL4